MFTEVRSARPIRDTRSRWCDGDGEHVIDDHGSGREQRRHPAEVELRHRVRTTALRMRRDHLRVRDDQQRQHPGDHERQRDVVAQCARSGRDEHEHHRFRSVGDARLGIEAERRESAEHAEVMPLVRVLSGSQRHGGLPCALRCPSCGGDLRRFGYVGRAGSSRLRR
jgi:hypothetical protein